jgi:hypothetical protein
MAMKMFVGCRRALPSREQAVQYVAALKYSICVQKISWQQLRSEGAGSCKKQT